MRNPLPSPISELPICDQASAPLQDLSILPARSAQLDSKHRSLPLRVARSSQTACKPGSVRATRGFPWIARDGHSSGTRLTARLARPTRATRRERLRGHGAKWVFIPCRRSPLFGLAPGGVCRAAPVARGAVRFCRTISPLPAELRVDLARLTLGARAVCFLWHCP